MVSGAPLVFSSYADSGWRSIFDIFLEDAKKPESMFRGYLDAGLTAIMMTCAVIVLVDSIVRWRKTLRALPIKEQVAEAAD